MEQTYCKHEVLVLVFNFLFSILVHWSEIETIICDYGANGSVFAISLGCKAIFLLGGKSREDEPLAMFLRSGDVALMAGEARECFHGQSCLYYFFYLFHFRKASSFLCCELDILLPALIGVYGEEFGSGVATSLL